MAKPEIQLVAKPVIQVVDVDEIRSIFCLKKKEDMARVEEEEDCFILDFDPFEQVQLSKLCLDSPSDDDSDLVVLAEKGKVACRDYPHPRHLCAKYQFDQTSHDKHCNQCYCVVCNKPAPCKQWNGHNLKHCDATDRKHYDIKKTTTHVPIVAARLGTFRIVQG